MRRIPAKAIHRGLFEEDYSLDHDLVCPECKSTRIFGKEIPDKHHRYRFTVACMDCEWDYLFVKDSLKYCMLKMPYPPMECDACDSPELYNSRVEEWQCPFCT